MSRVIPREQVKKLLTERLAAAQGLSDAMVEVRFAAALKAARLANKPTYRPEEVAALGQAMMASALDDVSAGLTQIEALQSKIEGRPPDAKP